MTVATLATRDIKPRIATEIRADKAIPAQR